MSERAQEWMFWIAATILVAMIVHLGAIYLLPRVVMMRALDRLGAANTMHVGKRPTAAARAIVRPSPDIVYATCPYDLSKGPLRVTAPVIHTSYWSVSAFDANTNNFFVKNDQQTPADSIELVVVEAWPGMAQARRCRRARHPLLAVREGTDPLPRRHRRRQASSRHRGRTP